MAQFTEACCKTFIATGALAEFLRVSLTAGKLVAAGIAVKELGTMERPAKAADEVVPVRLRTAPGTVKMVASAALAVGADVFTAAAGKVGASASTAFYLGTCLHASAADGDVIEVLRAPMGDSAVA